MTTFSVACVQTPPAKTASWIDRLLDAVFCWLDAALVHQAAGELARECRDTLWEHLGQRLCGMSHPQSMGYVRAVAPEFLAREVDVVLNRRRLPANLRAHVIADALEQVVGMVAEDVSQFRGRKATRARAA
jgi:hypothetical protein